MSSAPPPLSSLPIAYVNASRGHILTNTAIAFTVFEITAVSLRYLSKRIGRNAFGADDWLVLGALICCLGLNATAIASVEIAGVGRHLIVVAETDPSKLVDWAKIIIAVPSIYLGAVSLPKLAILAFYLRIFPLGFPRFVTFVSIAIIITTFVVNFIVSLVECVPLAYLWDKTIPDGHCININMWLRYGPLPNILTDLLMLVLPMPAIWAMNASCKTKIGVSLTLLTGSIGLVASILRTVAFFTHVAIVDGPWATVVFYSWCIAESGFYTIAACLICYRPLMYYIVGRSADGKAKRAERFASLKPFLPFSWRSRSRSRTAGSSSRHDVDRGDCVELPRVPPLSTLKMPSRLETVEDEETLVGSRHA